MICLSNLITTHILPCPIMFCHYQITKIIAVKSIGHCITSSLGVLTLSYLPGINNLCYNLIIVVGQYYQSRTPPLPLSFWYALSNHLYSHLRPSVVSDIYNLWYNLIIVIGHYYPSQYSFSHPPPLLDLYNLWHQQPLSQSHHRRRLGMHFWFNYTSDKFFYFKPSLHLLLTLSLLTSATTSSSSSS